MLVEEAGRAEAEDRIGMLLDVEVGIREVGLDEAVVLEVEDAEVELVVEVVPDELLEADEDKLTDNDSESESVDVEVVRAEPVVMTLV